MSSPHPLEASLRAWLDRVVLLSGVTSRVTSVRLAAVQLHDRVSFVVELTDASGETRQLEMAQEHGCPVAAVRTAVAGLRTVEDERRTPIHHDGAPVFRSPYTLRRTK